MPIRRQQGFFMLEILAAAAMLMVVVTIAGLIRQSAKMTAAAADYTTAANLAQQQLELLKARDAGFWLANSSNPAIAWQGTDNSLMVNNRQFSVKTSAGNSAEHSELIKVKVTVSWHNDSAGHALELITLFDRNP